MHSVQVEEFNGSSEYIVVSLIFIVLVPLLLSLRMIKMEISLGHMVSDIALRGK